MGNEFRESLREWNNITLHCYTLFSLHFSFLGYPLKDIFWSLVLAFCERLKKVLVLVLGLTQVVSSSYSWFFT